MAENATDVTGASIRRAIKTRDSRRLAGFYAEGAHLAFTQAWACPDGTRVLCGAILELQDARIARQTVVQGGDE